MLVGHLVKPILAQETVAEASLVQQNDYQKLFTAYKESQALETAVEEGTNTAFTQQYLIIYDGFIILWIIIPKIAASAFLILALLFFNDKVICFLQTLTFFYYSV